MSVTEPNQAPVPHGHDIPRLTPYLCADDALAAIDFYQAVFGAVVTFPPMIGPDGRVGHCELQIGDSALSLASAYPEEGVLSPLSLGGTPVQLRLEVPDVDDVFTRAVAAGATVLREVELAPYGERAGKIRDPFGHNWFLTTVVEELAVAAINERFEPLGYQSGSVDEPVATAELAVPGADVGGVDASGPHHPDRVLGPTDPGQLFYFTFGVPDGARAEAFFGQLFEWEIMAGSQPDGYHIASPNPPGGIAGGTTRPDITLYFRVADIRQAVARVRQLGGTAEEPVQWASGWSATCRDDQGTPFSLSEPAPGY